MTYSDIAKEKIAEAKTHLSPTGISLLAGQLESVSAKLDDQSVAYAGMRPRAEGKAKLDEVTKRAIEHVCKGMDDNYAVALGIARGIDFMLGGTGEDFLQQIRNEVNEDPADSEPLNKIRTQSRKSFGYTICDNPNWAVIHTRTKWSEQSMGARDKPYARDFHELASALQDIHGVVDAYVNWYDVHIEKATAFSWDEIFAEAGEIIECGEKQMSGDPVLCYVRHQCAWFTTQKVSRQWGDDWGDAPYETNAGEPYADEAKDRAPMWRLFKVRFEGSFIEPFDGHSNSPYSVEAINAGVIPWLRSESVTPQICIPAGTPLSKFKELILAGGGQVFEESEEN